MYTRAQKYLFVGVYSDFSKKCIKFCFHFQNSYCISKLNNILIKKTEVQRLYFFKF